MKDIQPLEKKITALFTTLEAWAGWCAGMALSFVTPIVPFILLSLALVVADTVTGIIAARRRGELRTSRGYRRFVEKCAVYAVAVLSFHG
jgi:phage-related holin